MENLKQITKIVRALLEADPKTRNSDNYLYWQVIKYISREQGFALSGLTAEDFFLNMRAYGFPPCESVRRTRQNMQMKYPELAATGTVQAMRREKEAVYYGYAKDHCGGV